MPCGAGCSTHPCALPPDAPAPPGLCATRAVALAAFDDDGVITEANTAMGRLLGVDVATLPGRCLGDFTTPAGRVILENHLLPLLRLSGRVEELALQVRQAQGDDLYVMCSAVRQVVHGVGRNECAFMRMNGRKRIEAELLRVKRTVEHVPGALFQLLRHADGRLRLPFASDAARLLFGLTTNAPDDTAGPLFDAIVDEDGPQVHAGLQASARDMAPWRAEFRVRLGDAIVWRAVEAQPQSVGDGDLLWHGYASDISSRKAVELAQIERDTAQRASRAKSEFMARASHELRTPLNGILGLTQLLAREGSRHGQAELDLIEAAGRSLLRLVDDMLDVTALDAGQMALTRAALPLAPLLQRSLERVRPQAQAQGLALQLDVEPDLAVHADEARLEQVLRTLLDNALHYNRPQGWVRVSARRQGTRLCIAVADSGPGLDAAQRAQLFQPFNQLGAERQRHDGAGLSLVIAKGLAERMSGLLEVQSEPGQGSTFSLWLDAAPDVAAPVQTLVEPSRADSPAAGPAPAGEVPGVTVPAAADIAIAPAHEATTAVADALREVLYVEDNPVNVLVMESLLASQPRWRLRVAGDLASAEVAALEYPPQLLLLDMHLPDGHGIELLGRLRAHATLRGVPAIAVSADAMAEGIRAATAAGFQAYWTKPLDMQHVLAEIDRLLEQPALDASL